MPAVIALRQLAASSCCCLVSSLGRGVMGAVERETGHAMATGPGAGQQRQSSTEGCLACLALVKEVGDRQ
ncbi:MAG TPA: hypothetical protein VK979_07755, partial [Guyparkeria sp.]|nr:hypothetical protein [Guyparkeria sp.]